MRAYVLGICHPVALGFTIMAEKTKTQFFAKKDADRKWYLINADGLVLGRLATQVSFMLTGKNKPTYTPNADVGDFVVIINAEKVVLTGNKIKDKQYHHHTGWLGGLKTTTAEKLLAVHPERIIEKAVWGMVPKTKLGRRLITKLKVYAGDKHPHEAQLPQLLELTHRTRRDAISPNKKGKSGGKA